MSSSEATASFQRESDEWKARAEAAEGALRGAVREHERLLTKRENEIERRVSVELDLRKTVERAEAAEAERDDLSAHLDEVHGRLADAERKVARVEELRDEYKRDDDESLNTFGQHHPVAGIAYDHLTAALTDEETT